MTADDVVRIVRTYIEAQFPRSCPNCGRCFSSLREYLETTTHLDSPVLYAEVGDDPHHPHELGPMSLANCPCGTTLTVGSRNMPRQQMAELLRWARREKSHRGISIRELLHELRDRIDEQVLQESPARP